MGCPRARGKFLRRNLAKLFEKFCARQQGAVEMVGAEGFELSTYGTQNRRATRLRYAPTAAPLLGARANEKPECSMRLDGPPGLPRQAPSSLPQRNHAADPAVSPKASVTFVEPVGLARPNMSGADAGRVVITRSNPKSGEAGVCMKAHPRPNPRSSRPRPCRSPDAASRCRGQCPASGQARH
jgi:hypothetical protein